MLKAAKAYLSTQVTTATQGDLLLMLYDTAIKHLKQAKDKMAARDFAGKGILITKAIEIVSELHECLNKERGGEVAKNLSQVYFFCNTRLLQANMEMNPVKVDEVVDILAGLRQAFAQIIPGQEGLTPASQSAVLRAPAPDLDAQAAAAQAQSMDAQPAQAGVPAAETAAAGPPVAETAAAEAPEPAPAPAMPVNTARSRAASAYANSL